MDMIVSENSVKKGKKDDDESIISYSGRIV